MVVTQIVDIVLVMLLIGAAIVTPLGIILLTMSMAALIRTIFDDMKGK